MQPPAQYIPIPVAVAADYGYTAYVCDFVSITKRLINIVYYISNSLLGIRHMFRGGLHEIVQYQRPVMLIPQ